MSRRIAVALTIAALVGGVSSACSSSSPGFGSTNSGLSQALDSVSDGSAGRTWFEYGDLATLQRIGAVHPNGAATNSTVIENRWTAVVGVGESTYVDAAEMYPAALGLNPLAADSAVTVGLPPNIATRMNGSFDAAAIKAKLTAAGAKPRTFGSTGGLSLGADNSINLNNSLTTQVGVASQLDQVVVDGDRFASSGNATTLQQVLGGGSSLLHAPHYQDMANCLGDVVAAMIYAPKGDRRSTLVGVGLRTPKSLDAPGVEVLCSVPASGQQSAVHAAYAKNLAPSAISPVANAPVGERVANTNVADTGDIVQAVLTLKPAVPVGYLFLGVAQNLPGYWDGSCASPRSC